MTDGYIMAHIAFFSSLRPLPPLAATAGGKRGVSVGCQVACQSCSRRHEAGGELATAAASGSPRKPSNGHSLPLRTVQLFNCSTLLSKTEQLPILVANHQSLLRHGW